MKFIQLNDYILSAVHKVVNQIDSNNFIALIYRVSNMSVAGTIYGQDKKEVIVLDRDGSSIKIYIAESDAEVSEILRSKRCPNCGLYHVFDFYYVFYDYSEDRIVRIDRSSVGVPESSSEIDEEKKRIEKEGEPAIVFY